ncbi:tRNA pseudouridine(55) synthase TruB [Rhodocaloribacter litoris]|uniref:tRNA pseudouridine(55) synthase TruB n=1 Tax=Rhodocaloribacter litoris TaxID=2558931 RepID=UPI0014240027|nr:tRNA pseudouridine(55) synthase TruB [Rhodocaloribacter litoris]QXD14792.1 tRNA pseudouridine(55) synthase TruB [Rhodocaloribacter litoris]
MKGPARRPSGTSASPGPEAAGETPLVHAFPRLPATFEQAVLPVDKPPGWSSFDVIRALRRLLGVRKIGHAGTLDPMATGLLICLVGRATKRMASFMELPKTYEGTLRLGEVTPSYDAETEVAERRPWEHVTEAMLEEVRRRFVGEVEQQPPMYSAVKVGGERLYRKARRGEVVERPPRRVRIAAFELTGRDGPDVSFRVHCSKGTYIRTLAHDFGQVLGCGAHLVALRRTAIGPYGVEAAWRLQDLEAALKTRRQEAGKGSA